MFFSEEKNQKTLTFGASESLPAMARMRGSSAELKVFWFFSSEKNILPLSFFA
jgi:hypothetical protein